MKDPLELIDSRIPISVRSHFMPALTNSVLWVSDTLKREKYLKSHELIAKAAIGYLRNVAAQVALKGVLQYHIPEIQCREMSNKNRSYYYYEYEAEGFILTISQVGYATCFPKEALYRNMLMNRYGPMLFNEYNGEEIPYLLITFSIENNHLNSARLGIPVDYNGKTKWMGNECIDLFKEPHLTPAQMPAAIINKPKVEFLNSVTEVLKNE